MTYRTQGRLLLTAAAFMSLNACATSSALPPRADIIAVIEPKPIPPVDILTDPAASDLHNSRIEGWGERLQSAGLRLCRYFERMGMRDIACD